jgi:hypothetical protein
MAAFETLDATETPEQSIFDSDEFQLFALRYATNPGLHRTRPLAFHAFHANLLEALDDEKCPLHDALGTQDVRFQLGLAKDYRNAPVLIFSYYDHETQEGNRSGDRIQLHEAAQTSVYPGTIEEYKINYLNIRYARARAQCEQHDCIADAWTPSLLMYSCNACVLRLLRR